jgi:hypothetical protein
VVPKRKAAAEVRKGQPPTGVEDPEELARAENDLAGLDAMASPEDAAEELPDWGPGAPKHHRNSS